MNTKVNVLLATHNGSRFLCEQLRSLDCQTLPINWITIRDDGSTDGTARLLGEWATGRPEVEIQAGPKLGTTRNFLTLLNVAHEESDYFAFCDQDDVWLPNKLERAVRRLAQMDSEQPLMYCSRLEYVDEELHHVGYSRVPVRLEFANALVENVCTGCTAVLNKTARNLICRNPVANALIHDWWCYLVVSAFGQVVFDDVPTIKYRLHGSNQIGAPTSFLDSLERRLKRFLRLSGPVGLPSEQAAEFYQCYKDLLPAKEAEILRRFLAVRGAFTARVYYAASKQVWRQSRIDNQLLRALIFIGRV